MKIIKVIAIILVCIILVGCTARPKNESCMANGKYLFLVAGLDEAGQNTDVLFTVGIDTAASEVYVCQIPRDTYFNFGKSQNKINQIFSSQRSEGKTELDSMKRLRESLTLTLGADFDGYIAITVESFLKIVDALGGIEITLSSPMTIELDGEEPIYLKEGVNTVDSKAAVGFVRFRKGYATQDLGRIDAQKIFLNAIFAKLSKSVTLPTLLRLAGILQSGAFSDLKLISLVQMLFTSRNPDGATSHFVTLPGEAVLSSSGVSYYAVNRLTGSQVTSRYMFATKPFDLDKKMLKPDEAEFSRVYFSTDLKFAEYSNETVKDIPLSPK